MARSMAVVKNIAPVPVDSGGNVDIRAWIVANGIPAESVIDLGAVPNALMPPILREADVGLFPSRCEGGTNLVAMEAMACGLPVILSANTGHLDLIRDDNGYPLRRQSLIVGQNKDSSGSESWGESDPEEIAEALEAIYTDRETARLRGMAGAEMLAGMSWPAQIDALKKTIGL
ncbi:MAG: glycosyltransferase family 4 protein [Alphaproteobacteria bacterium]